MPATRTGDPAQRLTLDQIIDRGSILPADRIARRAQWQPRVDPLPLDRTPTVGRASRASGWFCLVTVAVAAIYFIGQLVRAYLAGTLS